ncbi:uncharacterized protein PRCAT00000991001 [Priceomyces carsonii]|uniref:uncharacterized protein n=1 Tax=Priceomyces carsonii TaxID=28549 RepID=UPI002ED872DF|nr:unnamed protein product [Priceomyces carsonii]
MKGLLCMGIVNSLIKLLCLVNVVFSLSVDVDDDESICAAAKIVADGEWNYYEGFKKGGTVGMFSAPNYWWNAGEAFGGLLDYYILCDKDNSTLKKWISDGMIHQAGEDFNYVPSNQSMTEGNDDQGVWGMTTMQAVERNFTDVGDHSWLELTQAIYNTMNSRWDSEHCGGGLRWQIFTWNSGYDYKNAIANGCLFHIAARLARYLGNETYAETAEKVWDWMEDVGFLGHDGDDLYVYDGATISNNCSDVTKTKWSYTYGIFMAGAAYMYNYTSEEKWLERTLQILEASSYFFRDNIMTESSCLSTSGLNKCNNDQMSFRSLFSRCIGLTSVLASDSYDTIRPLLETSAQAAAGTCDGGEDGVTCGQNWSGGYDGKYGLGTQMNVLEVLMALLNKDAHPPYTAHTGGSSKSNVNAGTDTDDQTNKNELKISGKDKAGAGALTAIVLAIILGGAVWMLF